MLMQQTDSRRVARARAEVRPNHSLPQYFYVDDSRFRQDLTVLRATQYLLAAHVSEVPRGRYIVRDVAGESIILVRDRGGTLRGFYNVCPHRGSRLCLSEAGSANTLVCPYHAWSFHADGRVRTARQMADEFDPSEYGLRPVTVRVAHGLVFVSLAGDAAPDFDAFIGRSDSYLARYGTAHAKVAARRTYRAPANWKLVAENNLECYHCTSSHQPLASINPGFLAREDDAYQAWEAGMRAAGRLLEPFADGPETLHLQYGGLVSLGPDAVTSSVDGKPVSRLMGDFTSYDGVAGIQMFNPTCGAGLLNDYIFLLRFNPVSVSETDYEFTWLVHEAAEEGRDYDPDRVAELWDITTREDKVLVTNNQAGVLSDAYRPGPFAPDEFRVDCFTRWYLRLFVDAPGAE